MQEPPVLRTNPLHRGFKLLARAMVPLGSVRVSRRAGSRSLYRPTRPVVRVPLARGFGCGQSPHSRLTSVPNAPASCLRKASISKATSAVVQAARLLTSGRRIQPAGRRVKNLVRISFRCPATTYAVAPRIRKEQVRGGGRNVASVAEMTDCNTFNSQNFESFRHFFHSNWAGCPRLLWRSGAERMAAGWTGERDGR
jgi:hypothetical protein